MPSPSPSPARPPQTLTMLIGSVLVLLILYTLSLGQAVLIPIVMAIILSLLFSPLVRSLQRRGVPAPAGAGIVLSTVLAIAAAIGWSLTDRVELWLEQAPQTLAQLELKLRELLAPMESVQRATQQVESVAQALGGGTPMVVRDEPLSFAFIASTSHVALSVGLIFVLMFYLLAFGKPFSRDLVRILPDAPRRRRALRIFRRIERDVSHYLVTLTLINIGQGLSIALICWLTDLPNPLLWGALAALLNYIPVLGPALVQGTVFAVSLWTFGDPVRVLLPVLLALASNVVEGQLLTPNILARRLTLNPVVVFLSLVVWGWLWGIAGVLMAVPILVAFKITCDHVPSLMSVGRFLGQEHWNRKRPALLRKADALAHPHRKKPPPPTEDTSGHGHRLPAE
ncbi:AI-2E family transporter [Marinivivus vitaminiproducens]|uniref:AI-2E family transporter n=1 Tax=Marinivivus vitaminiproducens TaxID=3035935 RepID=UPI002799E59B|nr:AI-2E family transporter [Geminicoccaceae bacterium SCSIO 64248]